MAARSTSQREQKARHCICRRSGALRGVLFSETSPPASVAVVTNVAVAGRWPDWRRQWQRQIGKSTNVWTEPAGWCWSSWLNRPGGPYSPQRPYRLRCTRSCMRRLRVKLRGSPVGRTTATSPLRCGRTGMAAQVSCGLTHIESAHEVMEMTRTAFFQFRATDSSSFVQLDTATPRAGAGASEPVRALWAVGSSRPIEP